MMLIHLLSEDGDVEELCRDVIAGLPGGIPRLVTGPIETTEANADVYVWDLDNGRSIPQVLNFEHLDKSILLVRRTSLPEIRKKLPLPSLGVLLKPVNRARLEMALEQAIGRQQRLYAHDMLRIDRDEILQCLLYANLKLQEYDQDRTNFLARVVHDFRTPLTSVSGYCGLLLGGQLGALQPEQVEVIQRMRQSIDRLSRLASAMFQLSVHKQVPLAPDRRNGNIEECFHQALHEILPLCQKRDIALSVGLEPAGGSLYFERQGVEQVIVNLLENACKFTPRFGSIQITGYPYFWERRRMQDQGWTRERRTRSDSSSNAYRVDIWDSGPAIPRENLQNIFEEYTSYNGGKDRSGAGLGLAICKMILKAHQGHIWAEGCDDGARFSFLLPLGEPEGAGVEQTLKAMNNGGAYGWSGSNGSDRGR